MDRAEELDSLLYLGMLTMQSQRRSLQHDPRDKQCLFCLFLDPKVISNGSAVLSLDLRGARTLLIIQDSPTKPGTVRFAIKCSLFLNELQMHCSGQKNRHKTSFQTVHYKTQCVCCHALANTVQCIRVPWHRT